MVICERVFIGCQHLAISVQSLTLNLFYGLSDDNPGLHMASLSVKQKTLIYLNKYKSFDPSNTYNAPWELTQDGIANALCISRAHASIILSQLKNESKAEETMSHIKNGKTKRKAYYITPIGMEEAVKIIDYAVREEINIDSIIDAKRQDPVLLLDKLSESDRYALGCLCAFHTPMPASALPPIRNMSLPTDIDGNLNIDPVLRDKVLASAPDTERAEWHGYAANYWFDRKIKHGSDYYECLHELLYQYVRSGRNRDACKLVSSELYYLINSIDDQLHDTVKDIILVEKYAKDILMLKISICLEYDEIDECRRLIDELKVIDSDCASSYNFDMEMKLGNRAAAEAAISDSAERDPMAKIRRASLLRMDGKYDEARELLMSIREIVGTDLDNFQLEKYIELARIDAAEGHYDEAYQRLSKARATVKNDIYDRKFRALERELKIKLKI